MKKQLLILITLVTIFIVNGQSNLVYNQTLYLNISENSVTVPENKTWKIISSNGAFFRIDGAKFDMYHEDTGAVRNMPTWVPSGKTIDAGTQANVFLSILEFNIVPISSTLNSSTAANAFGNVIPSTDSSSSSPTLFDSPKVYTNADNGRIWVAPPGVTNILVEAWGQGGTGGDAYEVPDEENVYRYGLGGGGGAYGYQSFEVIPGSYYTIVIDVNGTGLKLNDEYLIYVDAGSNGPNNSEYVSDWDINCILYSGQGGTSSAEFNIPGNNADCNVGGNGANGGDGGFNTQNDLLTRIGKFPGGGGAGGNYFAGGQQGGAPGGGGQLIIYF